MLGCLSRVSTCDTTAPNRNRPQVKNPSMQLAQRLRTISSRVRLIISGTPIQNNLSEMWALFDFAVPGLLGPLRQFKLEFEKPILQVRCVQRGVLSTHA